jgi:hypothetical protein
MWKVITVRCKGGATEGEKAQERALAVQEATDAQLSAIDKEYYDLRRENKAQYDETFRPLEEGLLQRAALPATEATSAEARASEYAASTEATRESTARREARYGITGGGDAPDAEDDYIRAIALTAVGNAGKESALETGNLLTQAGLGMGTAINQDIGQSFGRSLQGISEGLGHADAAFANFANQQQHANNAYLAGQQGTGALIQAGTAVAGMGISNYQTAQRTAALQGGSTALTWKAALSGSPLGNQKPDAFGAYG